MYGTHGMWATSGPSCSAKETPVWSSPASSGSAHNPLRAQPEGLVLCVLVPFLQTQKALFLMYRCCCIGSVLVMQLFLWNWAFSLPWQRLWFILNLAQRFPAPPFLLKSFFHLQHGFSYCGDHIPCSCLMPGRARRSILNPEGGWTRQPRPGMVVGNQDPSCAIWPQTRPSHHPSVFPLFSLHLLGNYIPANSCPRLTFHSPCLWQGLLAFAMPSASTAHPLLSLESRAVPLLLPGLLPSAL